MNRTETALPSDAILARLMNLHPKVIDLSLGRALDLLDRLGRPQDRLPPVVHVAGTNGKGSTIAALRSMAEAAGYKVHVYTSPHLTRFHERIRLTGELIEEDRLSRLLEVCEHVNDGRPITYFEITTCAAFKAFSETPADILLLETGLGGRLDSTNIVARPAVTAITPVSLDHMQFLGNTIGAIAAEKAAIQKQNVPSVIGPQVEEAMGVLLETAHMLQAPVMACCREWNVRELSEERLYFESAAMTGTFSRPSLCGPHQTHNAGTALAIAAMLREQGFHLPDMALDTGLQKISWPARLQTLSTGPIANALHGWKIVLDGGHNQAAGKALGAELSKWAEKDRADYGAALPVHMICGMMNSKASQDFLAPLAPYIASLSTVEIPGEKNSYRAMELENIARGVGFRISHSFQSVELAVQNLKNQSPPCRLLICGSLYLAGKILAQNT